MAFGLAEERRGVDYRVVHVAEHRTAVRADRHAEDDEVRRARGFDEPAQLHLAFAVLTLQQRGLDALRVLAAAHLDYIAPRELRPRHPLDARTGPAPHSRR